MLRLRASSLLLHPSHSLLTLSSSSTLPWRPSHSLPQSQPQPCPIHRSTLLLFRQSLQATQRLIHTATPELTNQPPTSTAKKKRGSKKKEVTTTAASTTTAPSTHMQTKPHPPHHTPIHAVTEPNNSNSHTRTHPINTNKNTTNKPPKQNGKKQKNAANSTASPTGSSIGTAKSTSPPQSPSNSPKSNHHARQSQPTTTTDPSTPATTTDKQPKQSKKKQKQQQQPQQQQQQQKPIDTSTNPTVEMEQFPAQPAADSSDVRRGRPRKSLATVSYDRLVRGSQERKFPEHSVATVDPSKPITRAQLHQSITHSPQQATLPEVRLSPAQQQPISTPKQPKPKQKQQKASALSSTQQQNLSEKKEEEEEIPRGERFEPVTKENDFLPRLLTADERLEFMHEICRSVLPSQSRAISLLLYLCKAQTTYGVPLFDMLKKTKKNELKMAQKQAQQFMFTAAQTNNDESNYSLSSLIDSDGPPSPATEATSSPSSDSPSSSSAAPSSSSSSSPAATRRQTHYQPAQLSQQQQYQRNLLAQLQQQKRDPVHVQQASFLLSDLAVQQANVPPVTNGSPSTNYHKYVDPFRPQFYLDLLDYQNLSANNDIQLEEPKLQQRAEWIRLNDTNIRTTFRINQHDDDATVKPPQSVQEIKQVKKEWDHLQQVKFIGQTLGGEPTLKNELEKRLNTRLGEAPPSSQKLLAASTTTNTNPPNINLGNLSKQLTDFLQQRQTNNRATPSFNFEPFQKFATTHPHRLFPVEDYRLFKSTRLDYKLWSMNARILDVKARGLKAMYELELQKNEENQLKENKKWSYSSIVNKPKFPSVQVEPGHAAISYPLHVKLILSARTTFLIECCRILSRNREDPLIQKLADHFFYLSPAAFEEIRQQYPESETQPAVAFIVNYDQPLQGKNTPNESWLNTDSGSINGTTPTTSNLDTNLPSTLTLPSRALMLPRLPFMNQWRTSFGKGGSFDSLTPIRFNVPSVTMTNDLLSPQVKSWFQDFNGTGTNGGHKLHLRNLHPETSIAELLHALSQFGRVIGGEIHRQEFQLKCADYPLHLLDQHHMNGQKLSEVHRSKDSTVFITAEEGSDPGDEAPKIKFSTNRRPIYMQPSSVHAFIYFDSPKAVQLAAAAALRLFGLHMKGYVSYPTPANEVASLTLALNTPKPFSHPESYWDNLIDRTFPKLLDTPDNPIRTALTNVLKDARIKPMMCIVMSQKHPFNQVLTPDELQAIASGSFDAITDTRYAALLVRFWRQFPYRYTTKDSTILKSGLDKAAFDYLSWHLRSLLQVNGLIKSPKDDVRVSSVTDLRDRHRIRIQCSTHRMAHQLFQLLSRQSQVGQIPFHVYWSEVRPNYYRRVRHTTHPDSDPDNTGRNHSTRVGWDNVKATLDRHQPNTTTGSQPHTKDDATSSITTTSTSTSSTTTTPTNSDLAHEMEIASPDSDRPATISAAALINQPFQLTPPSLPLQPPHPPAQDPPPTSIDQWTLEFVSQLRSKQAEVKKATETELPHSTTN